ncbi:MAG: DegV family protein [Lachnospiraceae bacterium]|nr:DegV family protein [Lachnospiraceae bacterium]
MFHIIVDSGGNIPAQLAAKYQIEVLSFVNYIDGGVKQICYEPGLTPNQERIRGKDFYDRIRAGMPVKTGLISTGEFMEAFGRAMDAGEDVLYIGISSGISGTFNSAFIAARDVTEEREDGRVIRTVDTKNASLAAGILAIYAAEMRDKNMSVNETADAIEDLAAGMNGIFTVGDLKYLSRTGRISKASALIGNTLSIKPILRGDSEGHIVAFRKCRGRKAAISDLIDLLCDNIIDPESQIIGIAHADAYEESLEVMNRITERIKVRGFINTTYDMCTGSHAGPDTIALFFIGKDRELNSAPEGIARSIQNRIRGHLDRILTPERVTAKSRLQ